MRVILTIGGSVLVAAPAIAGKLELKVEVPKLDVAEYHRPYVAMWIERPDRSVAANLAVWYEVANKKNEGDKWLKDMKLWWRRTGRELTVPADGLTGATRPAGEHTLKFDASHPALANLAPGEYELIVEAAREVGDREVVRLPLKWPADKEIVVKAQGKEELGAVSVTVQP